MMPVRLLHLDSSAQLTGGSVTRRLSTRFARTWRAVHREADYHHRDLVTSPVEPIGPAYCALGRRVERRGLTCADGVEDLIETVEERREWDLTRALVEEVLVSDVLLIGAPMYNYAAPAALKAWVDRVTFPGAFADPAGSPLLADLDVVIVSSCGGAYGPGTGAPDRDFLTPWLRAYFVTQGVAPGNIDVVMADRALATIVPGREHLRAAAAASLAAAQDRITTLAVGVRP